MYIIVRDVKTDELRVCPVPTGFTSPADPAFRWAGWWKTEKAARKALAEKSEAVRAQLYGDVRPITGTPGPESVAELLRF